MTSVFLSYAIADEGFASELGRALADRGAKVLDPRTNLRPGDDFWKRVVSQLKRADLLLFVVPRYEGQGKSALEELGAAKALGKRIVAVLPERSSRGKQQCCLSLRQHVFLRRCRKERGHPGRPASV